MKAAWYETQGTPSEAFQVGEMGDPAPGPGEVRVRMQASGVNPTDTYTRSGIRKRGLPYPRIVPHQDGAGIIDAVGEGVPTSRVGERVWLYMAQWQRAFGTCCTIDDLYDARRVAATIGIPHYIVNFENQFGEHVIANFVREYTHGRTPIPCSHCNSDLKFATLAERAAGFFDLSQQFILLWKIEGAGLGKLRDEEIDYYNSYQTQ